MRIDRKRLEESIEALGRVGATAKGGLNRVALTDEDQRGRDSSSNGCARPGSA